MSQRELLDWVYALSDKTTEDGLLRYRKLPDTDFNFSSMRELDRKYRESKARRAKECFYEIAMEDRGILPGVLMRLIWEYM